VTQLADQRVATYPVVEVFGPTIQGEGAMAGLPTYFVRLGGCDWRCAWCDSMHAVDPAQVGAVAYILSRPRAMRLLIAYFVGGFGVSLIAGGVIVGTGSGSGAFLAPGIKASAPGTLTIQSALTFNSDSTYNVDLDNSKVTADKIVATGVTIATNAQFSFNAVGHGTLPLGTVFTVIDNTAATPIAGVFSNLADGSTFAANGNNFHVSYEGADGNNLTLTVVP
jgi:hypothetical protein